MSLAETETTNVESIVRAARNAPMTALQQFAKCGLALTIVDFRRMCEELCAKSAAIAGDPHDVADLLYAWMTNKLDQDAGK